MIPSTVEVLLGNPSPATVAALLADDSAAFAVDWREEDDAIVEYCEGILKTGALSAEVVDTDGDPGFELHIAYAGKKYKPPLIAGPEDRHITLHSLNRILAPKYEIRVCVDSNGSDTLVFLPLAAADWSALEAKYGPRVAEHFRKIMAKPNLFTEEW